MGFMSGGLLLGIGLTVIFAHGYSEAAQSPFGTIPKQAPAPASNPTTTAKVTLGKTLFFDPRLSATGSISCNSCHNVMAGGDDNLSVSFGIKGLTGKRSSPTVWNSGMMSVQFWDGRAASLEDQAKGPMTNPVEMGMSAHDVVISRIRAIPGYLTLFKAAFDDKEPVTIDNAAKAIAAFERTLQTPDSPFDLYLKGDKSKLSAAALRGYNTVQEVGCTSCHQGVNFAGPQLPVGRGFYQKFPLIPGSAYEAKYKLTEDLGRFEETKAEADKSMWRVPTWRNVAVTAPYFHNGSVPTLDEAIRVMAKTQLNKELSDNQVADITAFLESLTGKFPKMDMPRLPETSGKTVTAM